MKRSGWLNRKPKAAPKPRKRINPIRKGDRRGEVKDPAFLDWCAAQPCCISGEVPATTHHVRSFGGGKNDRRAIRLAARFHLHDFGPHSIERLGKRKFEQYHGISIEDEIRKLNARYDQFMANGALL